MKKIIAILLSLSMITALAGCKKKSEETTKETTESSETEVSETESSSESETEATTTTTATTSETTESSEPEETSSVRDLTPSQRPKDYQISPDFKIASGAENLQFNIIYDTRAYAMAGTGNGDAPSCGIHKHVDKFDFFPNTVEGYEQLWNSVQANGDNLDNTYNDAYDKTLPLFIKACESGNLSRDYYMESYTHIYRADSEYLSYYMTQDYYDGAVENTSIKTFNYRSSDGCPLTINDIVTDRAGFADFVLEYVLSSESYNYVYDAAKAISELIRNENAEVEFLLSYDSIYLISNEENGTYINAIKIPAMYCGQYLDMSYFGTTPDYFTLSEDVYDRITWDLNGDGKMDEIYPEFEKDEYGNIINMNLVLNGSGKTALPSDEIPDEGLWFVGMKLMKTDSGFYAYVELSPETMDSCVFVFQYANNSFTYRGKFFGNIGSDSCYDPDRFQISNDTDIFGTGLVSYTCSVIGNNGLPRVVDAFGSKDGVGIAKIDIECNEIDKSGNQIGKYTIKAGTPCLCIGLDEEGKKIHLMVLNQDPGQNKLVELYAANENGHFVIGSKGQDEAFSGLRYAG